MFSRIEMIAMISPPLEISPQSGAYAPMIIPNTLRGTQKT
jgi:hypothetical protein